MTGVKEKYLKKNLSKHHFIHQQSHKNLSETELRLLQREVSDSTTETEMTHLRTISNTAYKTITA
jgi:hypothetical protein